MNKKNNSKADELREVGNSLYKSSKFFDALIWYNKSICKATAGSRELALGFANRSAVYFELREYEFCLENINLATDCGYPKEKLKTLMQRKEKCLDLLELHEKDPNEDPWSFFKLTHPPNGEIPYVASCIMLQESKRFGRHLITTKALKTGDIIIMEEPFHKVVFNSARFSHCATCIKNAKLNLFPCLSCNFVMFCSKDCMTIGARFHQFECQRVKVNIDNENFIFEVPHRMVFEALGMFGKIGDLQKFLEEHAEVKTVFDFDLAKAGPKQKEKMLLQAVNSLQRNPIPQFLESDMDLHVGLMQSITNNKKHRKFLGEFMRKQMEIFITNSFGNCRGNVGFGSGVYPFSSFLNHSCAPNLMRVTVENKLVFVVARPIQKNQQLFVSYRRNFFRTQKNIRQNDIRTSYRFECTCEACTQNYPTIDKLFTDDFYFEEVPDETPSGKAARDEFKKNCAYIDKHIKNFPNSEICTYIERNLLLLESISRSASFISLNDSET